jgi:hypothetical protein
VTRNSELLLDRALDRLAEQDEVQGEEDAYDALSENINVELKARGYST